MSGDDFLDSNVLIYLFDREDPRRRRIAEQLIEQASWDDAMYALYVRQKLERSLQAAQEGKVISQEDMEKRYLNDAD